MFVFGMLKRKCQWELNYYFLFKKKFIFKIQVSTTTTTTLFQINRQFRIFQLWQQHMYSTESSTKLRIFGGGGKKIDSNRLKAKSKENQ